MISIKHVYKRFGRKEILSDITCELDKGIYGLLGSNGAGKTTLMRCLTNLYPINGGKIEINGVSSKRRSKTKIGYLPQFFGLYKELTVWDSMRYFCNLKRVKRSQIKDTIKSCLAAVNMTGSEKTVGRKLSGGMMRRVGIAQALIDNPELILFDEPTAGLDPEERMHFKNIVSGLGKNETVIISTHIVEDIEACCDSVIVMKEGRLLGVFSCRELAQKAAGKVYACKKSELPGEADGEESGYFIEKQYEEDGEIFYRVLTNRESENLIPLAPNMEDGYMCMIKDIA